MPIYYFIVKECNMNCNNIIKLLRVQKFYTQQQVADMLNICQKTYSDYELGNTRIPVETLVLLARFYNVDMNYICGVSKVANAYPAS